jgi:hypothetical protein
MKRGVFLENVELNADVKSKFFSRLLTEFSKQLDVEKRERLRTVSSI